MAKKVMAVVKLQCPAGKATPAPPVGPALGQYGINIMEFVKTYNERTAPQAGTIIPVEITIFEDRSFTFVTKTPPASELIKKAIGAPKGSDANRREPAQALELVKKTANAKFDETVDVAVRLGVDPRHGDQMVRGTTSLPHGTGKARRVAVFAKGEKATEAEEAGADVVGAEDLVEKIRNGWREFDVLVATPD